MKKIILTVALLALPVTAAHSQQPLETQEMVAITPVVCREMKLPEDARNSLTQKTLQMANQNGFGSQSGRFSLTPVVVVLDKQVMATTPAQYMVELQVSFYVLDAIEKTIIDETSVTVKGVDRLENKAFIQAVNQINPRSATMRRFMNGVREKVLDYYATSLPNILTKAEAYAQTGRAEEALDMLSDIPVFLDEYPLVADRMVAIYESVDWSVPEPAVEEKPAEAPKAEPQQQKMRTVELVRAYRTVPMATRVVEYTNDWVVTNFNY